MYTPRVRSQACVAAVLVVLSAVFQASFITLDAFPSDEGLVLVASDAVAHGRLLYRDCHVPVTPAVYWLQGAAFKLLGSHFLVSRALMLGVYAATVGTVFTIATAFLPLRRAALAGALAIPLQLWMWPHAQFVSYNALAIALCLLGIALAWRVEAGPRRRLEAFGLGIALGAGLWTKPNLALATGAGVLLYWLGAWLRSVVGRPPPRPRGLAELLREGSCVLGGILALSAPLLVHLLATGSFVGMLESMRALGRIYGDVPTGLFPAPLPIMGQIEAVRLNPLLVLPGVITVALWENPAVKYLLDHTGWIDLGVRLLYYAPVALLLALAAALALRWVRRRWTREDEAALLTWCAGSLLYLTILPHPAIHYMVPTLLPVLPLGLYLEWRAEAALHPLLRTGLRIACAALASLYVAGSLAMLGLYLGVPRAPVPSAAGTLWLPRQTARAWNDLLDIVRAEIPEGEAIFAYPYFPMLHFLTGHPPATRFVDLRPGSPGPGAEDEIIEALERREVQFVLYFSGAQYPGIEPWVEAYPRLQRYLETRFEPLHEVPGEFGTFAEIRRRKPREPGTRAQSG